MKIVLVLALLLTLAAFGKWAFVPGRHLPRHRVRHTRIRVHLRLHPGRGYATAVELWLRWGRFAAYRKSARIRRSLTVWQRVRRPRQHSIRLGRGHYRHRLAVPLEEHVLLMAPPRTFKTALLASIILHYPGPVISTTTKADVFTLTSGVRSRLGPVHVFNPQSIGGVPSTFRWSPVHGCEDPAVAIRRADAFAQSVSQKGVEDGTFWSAKASDYMRAYFHAAALAGADMTVVARWVLGGDPDVPVQILDAAGAGQWAMTLAELRGEAQKTAATVRMVMTRALSFMADPALAGSVLPGEHGFGIEEFLRCRGTLYMIADSEQEDAPVAPLFAAMASEIHYQAELRGQASPGGRLDPPLLMGLDEVTQICPVPLPAWLSDSGGKGIRDLRRRPRRSAAGRPVGRARQAGRAGHLLGEGVPARDHRHQHPGGRWQALRPGRLQGTRPGPPVPARRGHPGHDPPAARPVRPDHPGRVRPRHRPAPRRLERPGLPAGPPPRSGRRRPHPRRSRARARHACAHAQAAAHRASPAPAAVPDGELPPDPFPHGTEFPWS